MAVQIATRDKPEWFYPEFAVVPVCASLPRKTNTAVLRIFVSSKAIIAGYCANSRRRLFDRQNFGIGRIPTAV